MSCDRGNRTQRKARWSLEGRKVGLHGWISLWGPHVRSIANGNCSGRKGLPRRWRRRDKPCRPQAETAQSNEKRASHP